MATRLSDQGSFDHGAPGLQVTTRAFDTFLRECVSEERAAPIEPRSDLARLLARKTPEAKRFYAGSPSINAICAHLSSRVRPHQSVNASALEQTDYGKWLIHADPDEQNSATPRAPLGPFDVVVVTIPAPQAAELLGARVEPFRESLERVTYAPCMVAMLGLTTPIRSLSAVRMFKDPCLDSVIEDSAKPGRHTLPHGHFCYTLRATDEWSFEHRDDDRGDIAKALAGRLAELVPALRPRLEIGPAYLEGHRWRYAQVTNPVGIPFLANEDNRLFLAGDYCLGPNSEHAFLSGSAVAAQILSRFS
jgi:predicted NAD/FAD-dependent oxidoreductase